MGCSGYNSVRALSLKAKNNFIPHINLYKNKNTDKKAFFCRVTLIVVLVIVSCAIFFKESKFNIFNYNVYTVSTPSMEPEFLVNCIVVSKKEPFKNLKSGDVIVFKSDALGGKLAFHRITRIESGGVYTQGDKNVYEDNQLITAESYVGKHIFHTNFFAYYGVAVKIFFGIVLLLFLSLIFFYFALSCLKPSR